MRFRFTLETLRKHRKTLEDVARRELFQAQFALEEQRRVLKDLQDSVTKARQRSHEITLQETFQVEGLRQIDDFIFGQEEKIASQRLILRESLQLVEECTEALLAASIDYKIIDKLKEKKWMAFREELKSNEAKNLDELNTMRFIRGNVRGKK